MRKLSAIIAAIVLTGKLGVLSAAPVSSGVDIQAFNINSTILLEIYNAANQSSQAVNSYPSDLNPAVVQATIRNPTDSPITPCFVLVISDASSSCGAAGVITSPMITVKEPIPAGATKVLSANDFTTSGSYDGVLCQAFEDQMKTEFEGTNVSDIGKIVEKFLKHKFKVCLVEADCGSGSKLSEQACSNFTIFTPNPGAQASCPVIIYPHNNAVPNCEINFLWTPGLYPELLPSDISYQIEISEALDGEILARVDVPAGQTYYSWGAKDRQLENGKKYYWKVISRNAKTGATFGGPDGRGWNIIKWFTCGSQNAQGACRYSLADLDQLVKNRATPEVKAALKGLKIKALSSPGNFTDPDICKLINREFELNAINVTKK